MATTKGAPQPLLIFQLKSGTAEEREKSGDAEVEVHKENLEQLNTNLKESGASHVSIISVMGSYRTGKSFLLDLLARYLNEKHRLMRVAEEAEAAESVARAKAASRRGAHGNFSNDSSQSSPPVGSSLTTASGLTGTEDGGKQEEEDEFVDFVEVDLGAWTFKDKDKSSRKVADWILAGDRERLSEGNDTENAGFRWRGGDERCTQGVWIWSDPLVFKDKTGRQIGVLLMDTQGAWDSTMSKAQSGTIFGLTALLSQKMIYNVQGRIQEDQIEYIDYITTLAQTALSHVGSLQVPFGHLEILVRDWSNYKKGANLQECREHMTKHLDSHTHPDMVRGDSKEKAARLRSLFKSIHCYGLPHPSLEVTDPEYKGDFEVIDPDFFFLLNDFVAHFFGEDFPKPSAPLGTELTTSSFKQEIISFAEGFHENTAAMQIGLRDSFVKVEMMHLKEELVKEFGDKLRRLAPEFSVLDPAFLSSETEKLKQMYEQEFAIKLSAWKLKESELSMHTEAFADSIDQMASRRVLTNEHQVDGAGVKLVATPVVGFGAYMMMGHPFVFYAGLIGVGFFELKKWMSRESAEMCDSRVVNGVVGDIKSFGVNRWRDLQAMQILAMRCSPQEAMDSARSAARQAGAMAVVSSAAAAAAAPPTTTAAAAPTATTGTHSAA